MQKNLQNKYACVMLSNKFFTILQIIMYSQIAFPFYKFNIYL